MQPYHYEKFGKEINVKVKYADKYNKEEISYLTCDNPYFQLIHKAVNKCISVREEYEMRKQFKGKFSKLAQISRNTLVFAEYFQSEIHKEIQEEKKGKKIHSIEDKQRLITMTQKVQRLSKEANDTLTDIENPLNELID